MRRQDRMVIDIDEIKVVDYTAKRRRQLEQDAIMPPLNK